mgnify:CR=1 FL=1
MRIKKIKFVLLTSACMLLCGCERIIDYLVDQPETTPTPAPEVVATPAPAEESLHPNEVSDYDRRAVTSLINQDLKSKYGKGNYNTLYEDGIYFEKKDGMLTASGEYTYRQNGTWDTMPFTYTYMDQNKEYVFVSLDDESNVTPEMLAESAKANLSGRQPDRTYDVSVSSGIQLDLKHNGEGTMLVRIVDSNGKTVKEVVNKSGYFDESYSVSLSAGTYQIQLICDDGGWSLYYSSY